MHLLPFYKPTLKAMPPKHGNQEFYDNTEKCTAETILADLPSSGPFTLVFRSQCMVYLLEDLPACQKVSFFLDFLFVLPLLSQETPPSRGGLDNPACPTHTLPNTISLSSLPPSLLKIRKVYFSQNVVLRQMSLRASVCPAVRFFLQVPEPEILIFAREPVSRNWWKCKKKALT